MTINDEVRQMNMKQNLRTLILLTLTLPLAAYATEYVVITPLDAALVGDDISVSVRKYMENHSLDSTQMMKLLDANIETQLEFEDDDFRRDATASTTLYAMTATAPTQSLDRLLKYSNQNFPEYVRATAVRLYIRYAGDAGFAFATNVMTQSWRSSGEHDLLRKEFNRQARSASPQDRYKYADFMKWAIAYDRSGGFRTWDRQLTELDPSWRTNHMRRAAAESQKQRITTPTGTNIILEIIRDYEIASGICPPEPPPAPTAPPEEATSSIPPPSASVQAATGTDSSESAPVETTRRTPWLGAVLVVVVAAIAVTIIRRRK